MEHGVLEIVGVIFVVYLKFVLSVEIPRLVAPTRLPASLPRSTPTFTCALTCSQAPEMARGRKVGSLVYELWEGIAYVQTVHLKGVRISWSLLENICGRLHCSELLQKLRAKVSKESYASLDLTQGSRIYLDLLIESKTTETAQLPCVPTPELIFTHKILPSLPEGVPTTLKERIKSGDFWLFLTVKEPS